MAFIREWNEIAHRFNRTSKSVAKWRRSWRSARSRRCSRSRRQRRISGPYLRGAILRNAGAAPWRITGVDGGCSCRKIDNCPFPKTLRAGSEIELAARLQSPKIFQPLGFRVMVRTDQGEIPVVGQVLAMPDHSLIPTSIVRNDLSEGEDFRFEVTHREIFVTG
jgi:hypothetical protein